MNKKKDHDSDTGYLFYSIFSFILVITWFFPYYERCASCWGRPCNGCHSITGFTFMTDNFITLGGILGVILINVSTYLFYISKVKSALILVILSNILIGISLIYISSLAQDPYKGLRYDIYLFYHAKIGYIIGLFAWSIMCGMTIVLVLIEMERKYLIR